MLLLRWLLEFMINPEVVKQTEEFLHGANHQLFLRHSIKIQPTWSLFAPLFIKKTKQKSVPLLKQ